MKHLYNRARSVNSEDARSQYCTIKNQINKEIDEAHKKYLEKLFDNSSSSSHKSFWSMLRAYVRTSLAYNLCISMKQQCTY